MFIELALFVAVVAAMGATVVKVYEWRQDVLYGPYLGRDRGGDRVGQSNTTAKTISVECDRQRNPRLNPPGIFATGRPCNNQGTPHATASRIK
jgi:hypothetical protein